MWRNCLPSPAYRRGRQLQPEQALTQSEAVRAAAVTAAASLGVPDAAGLAPPDTPPTWWSATATRSNPDPGDPNLDRRPAGMAGSRSGGGDIAGPALLERHRSRRGAA